MTVRNPNPQQMEFSAYEGVTIRVTMRPALTASWPGGATFQLNIRDQDDVVVIHSTSYVVINAVTGVVDFALTSAETGDLNPQDLVANPEGGDYKYDCWRTDSGNEKRLAWGSLSALPQQWKP